MRRAQLPSPAEPRCPGRCPQSPAAGPASGLTLPAAGGEDPPQPSASGRGAGARSYYSALNGHFKLRASPRRVFTRLNCSLIMRGFGRSTWEVWGWLGGKKKTQITKTPNQPQESSSGAGSLGAAGFFPPPAVKRLQV